MNLHESVPNNLVSEYLADSICPRYPPNYKNEMSLIYKVCSSYKVHVEVIHRRLAAVNSSHHQESPLEKKLISVPAAACQLNSAKRQPLYNSLTTRWRAKLQRAWVETLQPPPSKAGC